MSDRPEGDELDQELRCAMSDVAAVPGPAPEFDELFAPTLSFEGEETMKNNSRFALIAAAAAVVAIVLGVIFLIDTDQELKTTDTLPAELFGVWLSPGGGVWTISEGVIAVNGGSADEYTYVATDTTIELTDADCGKDVPGTYGWASAGDDLALKLIGDECLGRSADLDGATFRRAEPDDQRPEELLGVWLSSQVGPLSGVWTFSEGSIVVTGRAADEFTYVATDATLELTDADCGQDVPATYEWAIAGDLFGLKLVSDECSDGTDLDGVTFQRANLDQQRAEDLLSVWESGTAGRWVIGESRISIQGGRVNLMSYTATDSTIEFVGSECGSDLPGIYEWVIAGDVLYLTLVSDVCSRRFDLDGRRFHRDEE